MFEVDDDELSLITILSIENDISGDVDLDNFCFMNMQKQKIINVLRIILKILIMQKI